jgi:hypothetical protein
MVASFASRFLPFLALLVLCGCTTVSTRQYRADEEQTILEAVLLDNLASWDKNRVVFVATQTPDGTCIDLPDAVISRIRAAGVPARNASESTTDEHTAVIDKASGNPGIIYYAGVLKWSGKSKVEVVAGTTCASLGGGFTKFIMKKRDGKWIRTKIKIMVTI